MDLSQVNTWRLGRDSNPRPFGREATNLPMSYHAHNDLSVHDICRQVTSQWANSILNISARQRLWPADELCAGHYFACMLNFSFLIENYICTAVSALYHSATANVPPAFGHGIIVIPLGIMIRLKNLNDVNQWCTTCFGRGPQIDLLNPSGPNRCHNLNRVTACQNLLR